MKDFSRILQLPPPDRLALVEAIWDSLLEIPEAIPIGKELGEELDRRLEAYYQNRSAVRPWEEVRKEIFGRK